jgi:hypothetical protein
MTPKEKAKELIDEMGFSTGTSFNIETGEYHPMYRNQYAKACALIEVNNIIKVLSGFCWSPTQDYWQEVKKEIVFYE